MLLIKKKVEKMANENQEQVQKPNEANVQTEIKKPDKAPKEKKPKWWMWAIIILVVLAVIAVFWIY